MKTDQIGAILDASVLVQFLNCLKACAFNYQPSKSQNFKCFQILNVRFSDHHCRFNFIDWPFLRLDRFVTLSLLSTNRAGANNSKFLASSNKKLGLLLKR